MAIRFKHVVPLILIALSLLPCAPLAVADGSTDVDTRERFFGAVQAIYNPDRAAQAGVQWERLIFPWSLIQKDGRSPTPDEAQDYDQRRSLITDLVRQLSIITRT